MQIIKQPIFKPCECEICGTLFKLEADDQISAQYIESVFGIEDKTLYGKCPVCGFKYVPLEKEG